ncbi:hypothetical protein HZB69_03500 [Candidatus Amesbacteria bacterium]|nr:hypothetical protein [Candidatus Amesbacteria bacterium]
MIVVGMGGSHLAADLLKLLKPDLDLTVYSDYGLLKSKPNELVVLSSYSGNTEEVLDAYDKAAGLNRAIITTGGQLLDKAKADGVRYIQLPSKGLQPRDAVLFMLKTLYELLGEDLKLPEALELKDDISSEIANRIPLIYTSVKNEVLGYIWKIKFNETSKTPAFNNVLPEADHNEINSFAKSKNFYCLFLKDESDHPQVKKRMDITAKLYCDIGIPCKIIELLGNSTLEKICNQLALISVVTLNLAKIYEVDPNKVPMIENLKKEL